jgi:hypothetical protein
MPKAGDGNQLDVCAFNVPFGQEVINSFDHKLNCCLRIDFGESGSSREISQILSTGAWNFISVFIEQSGTNAGRPGVNT